MGETKTGVNKTVMVLGVGNILLGDEGFGVHVARRLKEVDLPDSVRVEEGGVGGFNLLSHFEGVRRLIVVDVMMLDATPGELRLIRPGEKLSEPGKNIVSFHQVGVLELVQISKLIGYDPEVTFLVTRPQKMEWSMELSPQVQVAADEAVRLLQRLCEEFHLENKERGKEACRL